MTRKVPKKILPERRTNAERSATTRRKLIEAAIDILYKSGYSAATTVEVAKKAHVSRGAMLHQFPTRVHLLLAAAQHIIESNTRFRREQLGSKPGLERFYAASEVSWALHSRPGAIALLEIMMATRSDAELRKGFDSLSKNWRDVRRAAAERMAADLGITDTESIEVLITLREASLRGLAIELMFLNDVTQIGRAREMLMHLDRIIAERWMAAAQSTRPSTQRKQADVNVVPFAASE